MQSFFPKDKNEGDNFDGKKRSILERLFAVDQDVRHRQLKKHGKVNIINTNICLFQDQSNNLEHVINVNGIKKYANSAVENKRDRSQRL